MYLNKRILKSINEGVSSALMLDDPNEKTISTKSSLLISNNVLNNTKLSLFKHYILEDKVFIPEKNPFDMDTYKYDCIMNNNIIDVICNSSSSFRQKDEKGFGIKIDGNNLTIIVYYDSCVTSTFYGQDTFLNNYIESFKNSKLSSLYNLDTIRLEFTYKAIPTYECNAMYIVPFEFEKIKEDLQHIKIDINQDCMIYLSDPPGTSRHDTHSTIEQAQYAYDYFIKNNHMNVVINSNIVSPTKYVNELYLDLYANMEDIEDKLALWDVHFKMRYSDKVYGIDYLDPYYANDTRKCDSINSKIESLSSNARAEKKIHTSDKIFNDYINEEIIYFAMICSHLRIPFFKDYFKKYPVWRVCKFYNQNIAPYTILQRLVNNCTCRISENEILERTQYIWTYIVKNDNTIDIFNE